MSAVEGYTLNSTAGNSAPVGGRRRTKATRRKLRLLKKQIKKLGGAAEEVKDAIGGAEEAVEKTEEAVSDMAAPTGARRGGMAAPTGARRRRGTKKATRRSRKHRRSLFGLKY